MRVAVVDTYYPGVLDEHYDEDPARAEAGYDEQLAALLARSFGTADAYSWHFAQQGHEAADFIANAGVMQERWAREQDLPSGVRGVAQAPGPLGRRAVRRRQRQILMAQLEAYAPDVVYLHSLNILSRRQLDSLRARGRLVVGQIASPAPSRRYIRGFDLVVTSFPHFVERFRSLGVDCAYLPLAVDERVLDRLSAEGDDPLAQDGREHGLVFVGGLHPQVHQAGLELLAAICERRKVEVWGYGAELLPAESPILRHYRGEAYGLDMYRVLARSRIVINRHIGVAGGASNNMRLYEATAVGALLLTEPGHNLQELFEPGAEVVTYRDADDLLEAVDRLEADEGARRRIAAAGQARTLREHTFSRRIGELASLLEARLG